MRGLCVLHAIYARLCRQVVLEIDCLPFDSLSTGKSSYVNWTISVNGDYSVDCSDFLAWSKSVSSEMILVKP
jgi:hypothetical protein